MVVVYVENIIEPMIRFPLYGATDRLSNVAMLPKRKWGRFFTRIIKQTASSDEKHSLIHNFKRSLEEELSDLDIPDIELTSSDDSEDDSEDSESTSESDISESSNESHDDEEGGNYDYYSNEEEN